jgi:hyaluronoglucosaminidase
MKGLKGLKRTLVVSSALLLCVPSVNGIHKVSAASNATLSINPTPQEAKITDQGFPLTPKVGIVTGNKTDEQAVKVVVSALKGADVKQVVQYDSGEKVTTPVTIWIGGPTENQDSDNVLEQMGVKGPDSLKDEGYVLASSSKGQKQIVLAGKDTTGTFYAAETFKQIIEEQKGRDWFPGVEIRDWPDMAIRGSIEGFYGPPWTQDDRLSQLDFYGDNKLNTYIYAPKDDPYHREDWRDPYPDQELAKLKELIDRANENHVKFTFALSPGNSISFSSDQDFEFLKNKMQKVWDIGVRSFAIFLDDIDPNLKSPQDIEKFGKDVNPSAAAQAYLLNRFTKEFIQTHPGAERLITVPTDYAGNGKTPYRDRFSELLDKDTVVMWTGGKVVSETVSSDDAKQVEGAFKHDMLLWDNYPVNDYDRNSLFIGPIVGRDADLSKQGVLGVTANPMNEAEASKIPLYTIADYTWNGAAYNPEKSWERSIQSFGGDAADTLRTFAENTYSSPINNTESLTLTPLIAEFWKAYVSNQNLDQAAANLSDEFKKLQQVPDALQQQLKNKNFLEEVKPYMEKLKLYGEAGEAAVDYLMAVKAGKTTDAKGDKDKLITLFNQSEQIPQKLSQSIIKPFLVESVLEIPPLSLTVKPEIDAFWKAYDGADGAQAAEQLKAEFDRIRQIPENLQTEISSQEFLNSINPYLQNLKVYGDAGYVAVQYLQAQKTGEPSDASALKDQLKTLMVQAYQIPQQIGEQEIKPFLIESMWRNRHVVEYRKLDGINKSRGAGQLIQYTPARGATTGTNVWGYEITVVDDKVVSKGGNNSAIPANGYVLSIHASDWLADYTTIGSTIQIEDGIVLIIAP